MNNENIAVPNSGFVTVTLLDDRVLSGKIERIGKKWIRLRENLVIPLFAIKSIQTEPEDADHGAVQKDGK